MPLEKVLSRILVPLSSAKLITDVSSQKENSMLEVYVNKTCKNCSTRFVQKPGIKTQIFCCKNCGVVWRTKHVYKHKYSVVHRGRSVENFLKALCVKKSERRNLTVEFLMSVYNAQEGLCAISGVKMTYICGQGNIDTNISIDRIDPAMGYEEDNVQLVCRRINMMKMDKDLNDLIKWCDAIKNFNPRDNSASNLRVVPKSVNRRKQPKRG